MWFIEGTSRGLLEFAFVTGGALAVLFVLAWLLKIVVDSAEWLWKTLTARGHDTWRHRFALWVYPERLRKQQEAWDALTARRASENGSKQNDETA